LKRTLLLAVLICLFCISLLGCGATNKLQSVTLTPVGNGGFVSLAGEGGTLQFQAIGNFSNAKGVDVTNRVTYTMTLVSGSIDKQGYPLQLPPQSVTLSPTGLVTAVEPFVCSWTDKNYPDDRDPKSGKKPAWFVVGSYKVVATLNGIDSNPAYVALASASGDGPDGQCGP